MYVSCEICTDIAISYVVVHEVRVGVFDTVIKDGDDYSFSSYSLFPRPLHIHVMMRGAVLKGGREGGREGEGGGERE